MKSSTIGFRNQNVTVTVTAATTVAATAAVVVVVVVVVVIIPKRISRWDENRIHVSYSISSERFCDCT